VRSDLWLTALLWLCAAGAQAGVLDDVRERGVLRVGTTFDYRPFSYRDGDVPAGIDVTLARSLARALAVRVEWVETTWPTLASDLEDGRFDIAMSGISVTPARTRTGDFSAPYFRTGKSVLARCEHADRFRSLADIDRPDITIIVNPGGTNAAFVDREIHHARVVRHPDNRSIFDALESGAADLMITDAVEADIESRRHPGLCHARDAPYLEPVDKAWWMPRDAAFRTWVDAWLGRIAADGSLAATVERELSQAPR
jgi:ABC-type amino acid transport substrate-binding protein